MPVPPLGVHIKPISLPEQIGEAKAPTITFGLGLTVIILVKLFAHPLAAAVIRYVAVLSTFDMCERV